MSSLQRLWNLIDTKHHTKHHRSENCYLIATFEQENNGTYKHIVEET
jgi:hypothetical protein